MLVVDVVKLGILFVVVLVFEKFVILFLVVELLCCVVLGLFVDCVVVSSV